MSNVKTISHTVEKWLIRRLEWRKEKREKIIFNIMAFEDREKEDRLSN